jgi:endothelin-converting enzyme/putative endopeptidase
MRNHLLLPAALVAAVIPLAHGQARDEPLAALPYTPGLDVSAMDRTADPCADFYQYTCGGWIRAHPIPSDQPAWSVSAKMAFDNQRFLWGILEESARPARGRSAVQRQIGDYFAACMDEATVERRGAKPLQAGLARIAALRSKRSLGRLVGRLQMETGTAGFFFGFGSNQDFGDSTQVIAFAVAGGLGLPDRDYYTKDDEPSRQIRAKYFAHVQATLSLAGESEEQARRSAAAVMSIEDALARASLTRVESRDPYNLYHRVDRAKLQALTPSFDWGGFLGVAGLPKLGAFNVTEPRFFEELERQLRLRSAAEIRAYLRWHYIRSQSPYLSKAFVERNFDFYSRTLHGVPEQRPRWKRCVALVDAQLGEALGREFVRRAFDPALKEKILRMTGQIEHAMEQDIRLLEWMSQPTKDRALEKLHALVNKIGYPDRWRDYSPIAISRTDFFGNVRRAQLFESRRDIAKIGKPVDRGEWYMTPPSVNAYYSQQTNDINFAAGILQPPLYDPKMDDAPNYGNTGMTIGHELTHGFDDEGRKYDARGDLRDWWTPADARAFEERAQCVAKQFSEYTIVDDIKLNGELTLGENVADLGGLILAWMAWKAETAGKALEPRDGLTPEQRFFVGHAQWACESQRPETLRVRAVTGQHAPGKYRVNGLVTNMPQFAAAFSCKPGAPLAPEKRCRVW